MDLHEYNELPDVLLLSSVVSASMGGPSAVLRQHVALLSRKFKIKMFAVTSLDVEPPIEVASLETFRPAKGALARWSFAPGLWSRLSMGISLSQLVHAHMFWDYSTLLTWILCRRHNVPYILTLHGSLNGKWRLVGIHKQLYMRLFGHRILSGAAAIHSLNDQETAALGLLGHSINVVEIPNGISETSEVILKKTTEQKRQLLYLGRLWREKGLLELVRAWGGLRDLWEGSWCLRIVGPDYRNFRKELISEVEKLRLSASISIEDAVYDGDKTSLLGCVDGFVLPSHGEGLSMALLEAVGARLPVVVSRASNPPAFLDLTNSWTYEGGEGALREAIAALISCNDEERRRKADNAYLLAQKEYSTVSISRKLCDLYHRVISDHSR